MKLAYSLLLLCLAKNVILISFTASKDLKTLHVQVNPNIRHAVKEALQNLYKPNPNPFNSTFVRICQKNSNF
jgi:hypothetical protein